MFYLSHLHPPPLCLACDSEAFQGLQAAQSLCSDIGDNFFPYRSLSGCFPPFLALLRVCALQANLDHPSLYFNAVGRLICPHSPSAAVSQTIYIFQTLSTQWSVYLESKTGSVVRMSFIIGSWADLCLMIIPLLPLGTSKASRWALYAWELPDVTLRFECELWWFWEQDHPPPPPHPPPAEATVLLTWSMWWVSDLGS